MKFWIIGGIVTVLIIIGLVCSKRDKSVKVATELASIRTITEMVSVTGKIQPESEVKISADVSGEIIEMAVKEGDSVRKGQLLLRINPDIYQSTVSQLSANLDNGRAALSANQAQRESATASFHQAQGNYDRIKKLWEQKVASDQEMEQARLQYETSKANLSAADKNMLAAQYSVQSLAASLEQGQKNLGRTSIYSPAEGVITGMNSEKGERVVGTAQMAGTEILRVSNLNSMEVEVSVNENDIARIKSGDSADIKVRAFPDRVFRGIVTEIANSARFEITSASTDQATNYRVKVHIIEGSYSDLGTGMNQPFKSGMTATVNIKTQTKAKVLTIPIGAVTTREPVSKKEETKKETKNEDDEIKTWVFIYKDGAVKSVEVKTGIQDIQYFEVLSGLKIGDEVVAAPIMAVAKDLKDGDKVKKVDKAMVYEK